MYCTIHEYLRYALMIRYFLYMIQYAYRTFLYTIQYALYDTDNNACMCTHLCSTLFVFMYECVTMVLIIGPGWLVLL